MILGKCGCGQLGVEPTVAPLANVGSHCITTGSTVAVGIFQTPAGTVVREKWRAWRKLDLLAERAPRALQRIASVR